MNTIPIYYVVYEQNRNFYQYPIYTIIKCYVCDLKDVDKIYRNEVAPLYTQGRFPQAMIFYREPANPFREMSPELPPTFTGLIPFNLGTVITSITEEETHKQEVEESPYWKF